MNYQDGERDPLLCTGWGTERDNHAAARHSPLPPAVSFIVVMPLCLPARFAQKFVAAEAVAAQCLFAVHYRFQTCIPGQRLTFPDKAFSMAMPDAGRRWRRLLPDSDCIADVLRFFAQHKSLFIRDGSYGRHHSVRLVRMIW